MMKTKLEFNLTDDELAAKMELFNRNTDPRRKKPPTTMQELFEWLAELHEHFRSQQAKMEAAVDRITKKEVRSRRHFTAQADAARDKADVLCEVGWHMRGVIRYSNEEAGNPFAVLSSDEDLDAIEETNQKRLAEYLAGSGIIPA